jgi:uncharacterized protein (TIGR00251 family)
MSETRTVTVRVKPRSRARSIVQTGPKSYEIRTTEPPDKGRANEDVVDILSEYLNVPKSCVIVARGASSRTKIIKITA